MEPSAEPAPTSWDLRRLKPFALLVVGVMLLVFQRWLARATGGPVASAPLSRTRQLLRRGVGADGQDGHGTAARQLRRRA